MTIASKLFYCRRTTSRPSRSAEEQELDPLDADRDATLRRRPRSSGSVHEERPGRSQRRPDGPHRARRHRAARTPQESFDMNKSASECGESSRIGCYASSGVVQSRIVQNKLDDHLPGSVLQARARLLERLRGVHLTESRQETPAAADISRCECSYSEESSTNNCSHQKSATASNLSEPGDPVAEVILQAEKVLSFHDTNKKPCVLSHEEEVFINAEGDGVLKVMLECPICLEKFSAGEKVVQLQCGHRYHHACLEPWMQAHELCPYCRASIVG